MDRYPSSGGMLQHIPHWLPSQSSRREHALQLPVVVAGSNAHPELAFIPSLPHAPGVTSEINYGH